MYIKYYYFESCISGSCRKRKVIEDRVLDLRILESGCRGKILSWKIIKKTFMYAKGIVSEEQRTL